MKMQPTTCPSTVHNKCRCCLREGKHPHNIYKDLHLELIRDTLNLLLTSDSRLSEWICSPCVDSLMKVKRFRDTAVAAERHLLLTLGNTHSDIEAAEKLPEQLDVNRDPIEVVFDRVISVFQNSDLKVTNHIAVPNDQFSELYVKEEAGDVETDGDHDDEDSTLQHSNGNEGSIYQPAEGDDEDSTFQPSDDVAETEVKNDVFLTIGSTVVKKVTRQASRLSNEIKIPVPDTTPRKRHFVDKINSTKRVKHDTHPMQSGEKDGSKSDTLICIKNNKPVKKKTTGEAAEGSKDAVYSSNNNKNNVSVEKELVKKQPKLGLNILKPALKKTRRWSPLKHRDDTKIRDNIILTLKHSTILPFRFSIRNSNDYKCFYCEKMYQIKELREHTESQHVGKVSDKTIVSWLRARSIKYISAEISCIKCRLCGEQANTLESIIEHLTNVHNKVYQCTKNRPHGIHGILGYHLSSGDLKCHLCDKYYNSFVSLATHMNEHFGEYVCHVCGKKFLTKDRCDHHASIHSTKKLDQTFECNDCGNTYKSKTGIRYHVRHNHLKFKLKCPKCPKTFGASAYIKRMTHMIEAHGAKSNSDKKYLCDICPRKEFGTKYGVYQHKKEFHKTRNVPGKVCEICGYVTKFKALLDQHMDVHYGVKKFECDICGKKFAKRSTILVHMKMHMNIKKFVCSLCNSAFVQAYGLKFHMKSKHPDSEYTILGKTSNRTRKTKKGANEQS